MNCPCGSQREFASCCRPIIAGEAAAATAAALMRARYTAYTQVEIEFLHDSLHPDHRGEHDAESVRAWAAESEWHGLEIIATADGGPDDETGEVEFACEFTRDEQRQRHHERARFAKVDGCWYFVDGKPVKLRPFVRPEPKLGRNDPCSCGSGRKFKKCCGMA
jgi:SEC-C motif domain protein